MRQRETTLRLKLATRRTTTARLIDAQENTEQERQRWLRFQNAGARSHMDCTARARVSCPSCSNQLCRARPCSRMASSLHRPCDTAKPIVEKTLPLELGEVTVWINLWRGDTRLVFEIIFLFRILFELLIKIMMKRSYWCILIRWVRRILVELFF